ncbi:MAG: hypothetical protein SFU25_07500, partial [Candidatus Caenarcaniphilales bacterium]|nr:hypothetical protein [Candidatus Caenarcaniphilales bacterium]
NLDKNKLFFIDESDSNFLFAKVLSEGNFNYLIFNSNIGTISVYSLMPFLSYGSERLCILEGFLSKSQNTKHFKIFNCTFGKEVEWIEANGLGNQKLELTNPYVRDDGIVFSAVKPNICEIDKFILKKYKDSYVVFNADKHLRKPRNKCELGLSFCKGAYNESSCRKILKKYILSQTNN